MTLPKITDFSTAASRQSSSASAFLRKHKSNKRPTKEELELREQIEISKMAIASAQNQFESVVDPTLIDCYIYELNAAQLRYQFLLRSLKSYERK